MNLHCEEPACSFQTPEGGSPIGYCVALFDVITVEPLLRGHPDERLTPLERPHDNVNLNKNILIYTPDERPSLLKGHFSDAKGVASQEGFHCTYKFS